MPKTDEYQPPSAPDEPGRNSEAIEYLREYGPAPTSELPGSPTSPRTREVVGRLRVLGRDEGGPAKARPESANREVICYLYGDERRAVRRFIEEYPAFVESCLSDAYSPIHQHSLHTIFVEEWAWGSWEVDDA